VFTFSTQKMGEFSMNWSDLIPGRPADAALRAFVLERPRHAGAQRMPP